MMNLKAILGLDSSRFTRGMRDAHRSMGSMKSGVGELTKQLGIMTGAAGAVAVAFSGVKKTMDFESELSTIKALTGMTGSQMQEMRKLALDAGMATKYSALEASKGIEELAKAGMSTATIKAGGLTSALNLATAGGMELADSANLMSNAMNAFRADGLNAAKTADILAGAANASSADMMDLKYGLAAVGPVSAGLGMGLRDTSAALALFSNNALSGSDAGTSLKTMLSNLQPKTKAQTTLFRDLGLTTKDGANAFFDASGNIKSLKDVAGLLSTSLKGLTAQQRMATLETMFGSDAIRAGNILFQEGASGVQKMYGEIGKVTALSVAKDKMNNASGAVEQFMGALETLQISVLTPLMPVIRDGANALSDWMANIKPAQIKKWGDNVKSAGQMALNFAGYIKDHWDAISSTILAVAAATVTLKAGFAGLAIINTVTAAVRAFQLANEGATVAQALLNVTMLANPVGLIIIGVAALVAGIVLLVRHFGGWEGAWKAVQRTAAFALNFVIGKINDMIDLINMIPGVNIPVVAKVSWGSVKPPTGVADFRKLDSGRGAAGGIDYVPYDGYMIRAHRGEQLLTAGESTARSGGKGGGNTIQFGDIHLHGVGGDLEGAADKLLDIMAYRIQAAGNSGT